MDIGTISRNLDEYFTFVNNKSELEKKYPAGYSFKFMGQRIYGNHSIVNYGYAKKQINEELYSFFYIKYKGLCKCLNIVCDDYDKIFNSIVPEAQTQEMGVLKYIWADITSSFRYIALMNEVWKNVSDLKKYFIDFFNEKISKILQVSNLNINYMNPIWSFYFVELECPNCKTVMKARQIKGRWKHYCYNCGYVSNYKPVPKVNKY